MADTTYYYKTDLKTSPIMWYRGEPKRFLKLDEHSGSSMLYDQWCEHHNRKPTPTELSRLTIAYMYGLGHNEVMTYDKLPTEFFNHQVPDCDCNSEQALFKFVSDFGFPYSVYRATPLEQLSNANDTPMLSESLAGIEETNSLESSVFYFERWISVAEVKATISLLQLVSKSIIDYVRTGTGSPMIHILNTASCNPLVAMRNAPVPHVPEHTSTPDIEEQFNSTNDLFHHGFLTSAICNQVLDTLNDRARWRNCACTDCDHVFKRKQSKSNHPDIDSIYCCNSCMDRQRKRDYRREKRDKS